jgi:hypothetical protein
MYNDPKGTAGALKTPLSLIPSYAMEQTAWVHKLGAEKYGLFNWRDTGVCASTYVNAIMRHLNAWRDGETLDPESGISHLAHIACSCNILMDADYCNKLQDDRNVLPQYAPKKVANVTTDTEYYYLQPDDIIQEGDEYYVTSHDCWMITRYGNTNPAKASDFKYRRRIDPTEPESCSCGRIKINHYTMGLICEDCELKWRDPY